MLTMDRLVWLKTDNFDILRFRVSLKLPLAFQVWYCKEKYWLNKVLVFSLNISLRNRKKQTHLPFLYTLSKRQFYDIPGTWVSNTIDLSKLWNEKWSNWTKFWISLKKEGYIDGARCCTRKYFLRVLCTYRKSKLWHDFTWSLNSIIYKSNLQS